MLTTGILETFLQTFLDVGSHHRTFYRGTSSKQLSTNSLTTMSVTTLFCWVIDTPIKQIFPVKIGHNEVWGTLKIEIKAMKKPEFDDIAANTLDLWKVCHCAISHVVMLNSQSQRSTSIVPNVLSWNQKNT